MKLYIIIAVHNRINETLNCISLLYKQTFQDFEIVLIDDGSNDNTSQIIKDKYSRINIIKGDGSWWWTKSINIGIKYALDNNADFTLLLNNDIIFNEDYIEKLIKSTTEFPNSIIGSLNLTLENPPKLYFSGIKEINWWTFIGKKYYKPFSLYNPDIHFGLRKTVNLPGRGMLIPTSIFEVVGLFDEKRFPQYKSDNDFVIQACKNGIDCYINYDTIIYTSVHTTGEGDIYKKTSFSMFVKSFFNKYSKRHLGTTYKFFRKHVSGLKVPFIFAFHHLVLFYLFFKNRK